MNRRSFLGGSVCVLVASPLLSGFVGCDKSWMDNAQADVLTASYILDSVLSVVAVAVTNGQITSQIGDKIRQATQAVKTGLSELAALIASYKSSPSDTALARIADTLNQLAADLPKILDGITITDQNARTAITAGFVLLISIVAALQIIVPSLQATQVASGAAQPRVKRGPKTIANGAVVLPSREAVVTMYNAVLVQNGFDAQQIQ